MENYKTEFIEFLVACDALKFGEFTLKSGRKAPYFINTGMFDTGRKITRLGQYYARAIQAEFSNDFDGIYGPAYKGIPLCIATAMALAGEGVDKGYVFNRKEAKTYGDKSTLVGMPLAADTRLVLVDDVITSGKAIRESMTVLRANHAPVIKGIVISVDRQERGKQSGNALRETAQDLGVPVTAIVTLDEIISVLYNREINGRVLINDDTRKQIDDYLARYGATTDE